MPEKTHDALLWGIIIISTILLLAIPLIYADQPHYDPTIGMVFLVIFGVTLVIAVLTIASKTFLSTDLSCKDEALGLPAGSIRALIALSLIIIFAIMAIFMYNQLTPTSLLIQIPGNQTFVFSNGTAITNPNGMTIMTEATQAQRDFSTQTLTTVSTLVVALAGFYFGTKAATSGKTSEEKESGFEIITTPKKEVIYQKDKPMSIKFETVPKGENVKLLSVDGDKKEAFDFETSNDIVYTPSPERSKNIVTATLAIISGEKTKATKQFSFILEKMEVSAKKPGKAKTGVPFAFEVKTVSASGKIPTVKVWDDDQSTIDKTNIGKGEFTYKPSVKGKGRISDTVKLDIKLEGQPIITQSIELEVEP